jgi:hypothetical protein
MVAMGPQNNSTPSPSHGPILADVFCLLMSEPPR